MMMMMIPMWSDDLEYLTLSSCGVAGRWVGELVDGWVSW